MKASTKKYKRLKVIIELLSQQRKKAPTAQSVVQYIEDHKYALDIESVNERTIRRDIESLKTQYSAPISYCYTAKGYVLEDLSWRLPYTDFTRDEALASLLANKIADGQIPSSLKDELKRSEGVQLVAADDPEKIKEILEDLFTQSQFTTQEVSEEVSAALLEAWEKCQSLEITYTNQHHEESQKIVELHVIFLYNNTWYGYAKNIEDGRFAYFSVYRCSKATVLDRPFERDQEAVEKIKSGQVFEHEVVKDIELHCSAKVARYLSERKYFPEQTHKWSADNSGELQVFIPEAPYFKICPHILQFKGEVTVIKPKVLREKLAGYAQKILDKHK